MAHEELEKSELLGTEINGLAGALDGVGDSIDFQVGDFENGASGMAAPTENRADTCGKFGKSEWFCERVVGASIEEAHALFGKTRRGNHEDGKIGVLGANVAENLQAAFDGRIEIQNDEVVRLVGSETLGFPPVRDHLYGKLLLLQPMMEKLRQRRVVFSDKNAHATHRKIDLEGVRQ